MRTAKKTHMHNEYKTNKRWREKESVFEEQSKRKKNEIV